MRLKEMGHRVKNSLMIVTSMLQLQVRDIDDPDLTLHQKEASQRVSAAARAHDQLFESADIERMDLGKNVEGVCKDLDASVTHCVIHTEAQRGMELSANRAISAALVVDELIANAAKTPPGQAGRTGAGYD